MSDLIAQLCQSKLRAYEADPGLLKEHFGIEQVVLAGGYGYRQVLELVQNGADAILEAQQDGPTQDDQPRIEVVLAESCLCVANTGAPFSEEGIDALLRSHSSPKRGNQIGRFGLGFKSLLRLGGKIDITSGPVAFRFDPERCREELKTRFRVADAPGLRLAWTLEVERAAALRARFPWATTVVCAEVKAERFLEHLRGEIEGFPAEFLLFLPVTVRLGLDVGNGTAREVQSRPEGQDKVLQDGESISRWRVVATEVRITDRRAKDDATHVHTRDVVPLTWAVPLEGKREEAGRFWAFFPTHTPTYLPGILNAPWKLNSDRDAIIAGEWNTTLMEEAAKLIVENLPQLRTDEDPARPLDAFPRQLDRKDEIASPLVEALWAQLETAAIVPDATGKPRPGFQLWQHPRLNADLARQWKALAGDRHAGQLIHPSCLERQRASRLKALADRLAPKEDANSRTPNLKPYSGGDWFAAIASVQPDRAVQVLKLVEAFEIDCRPREWWPVLPTLKIILTTGGQLVTPGQAVIAPEGMLIPDGRHPVAKCLFEDPESKRILKDVLKVKPLDDSLWLEVLSGAMPRSKRG